MKIVALDTETIRGKAAILSWPDGARIVKSMDDIFAVLKELSKKTGIRNFCFYNLDYDAMAIFRHAPEILSEIYAKESVAWREYRFTYLAGKYLKIKKGRDIFHIFDLFPFFQCSLDKAVKKYIGKDDGKIDVDKAELARLTYRKIEKEKIWLKYAQKDAEILQKLADLIIQAIDDAGIKTTKLYSPGYLAKKYLAQNGFAPVRLPRAVEQAAQKAYFGGRIEVWQRGYFEKVWVYDLKSAYPAAMAELPYLDGAYYTVCDHIQSPYWIARIHIKCGPEILPYRTKDGGLIVFPEWRESETWITWAEADVLKDAEWQPLKVINIYPATDEKPFKGLVERLYKGRFEGGAKKIIYKLILNSLYGVMAERRKKFVELSSFDVAMRQARLWQDEAFLLWMQERRTCKEFLYACDCDECKKFRWMKRMLTRGEKLEPLYSFQEQYFRRVHFRGKWQNLVYAAAITGRTRVRLWQVVRERPDAVIAMFTDSVILSEPMPVPENPGLGDWELQYTGPAWIVGAGVYETEQGVKMRGFKSRASLVELIKNTGTSYIYLPENRRKSLGIVLRRGLEIYEVNQINRENRVLDLNFDKKRIWPCDFKNGKDFLLGNMTSKAYILEKNWLKTGKIKKINLKK